MNMDGNKNKREKLIDQLLSISFPFSDILNEQICSSTITVTDLDDYFCITFSPERSQRAFPSWLPRVPLAWQLLVDGVPILGQLLQESGFIEKYEIIDMGFTEIKWNDVLSSKPVLDTIYDLEEIIKTLTVAPVTILKAEVRLNGIDVVMARNDNHWVASFVGCSDCDISSAQLLGVKQLSVSVVQPERRYEITSCDGCVSIEFSDVYLCRNCQM